MPESKYQKNLVTQPYRENSKQPQVKWRTPSMTYVSDRFFPQVKIYARWGWIKQVNDDNMAPHIHSYDEIVLHIGMDPDNPKDLGGELEFMVEGEPVKIDKTSALYIPKGVKHGPLIWKKVSSPHIEIAIVVGTGNYDEAQPGGYKNEATDKDK
jgi:hypothetical protein